MLLSKGNGVVSGPKVFYLPAVVGKFPKSSYMFDEL
jgi:hypothetical protein